MENRIFRANIFLALVIAVFIFSCKDETEELIVPIIEVPTSSFYFGYEAGDTVVDFSSNVIFYATVDEADKGWLSYRFEDNCKTLIVKCLENNSTIERVGQIILSKSGTEEILTITQEGSPSVNVGGLEKVNLNFTIDNSSGYTILAISAEDVAKIPIGATVFLECPGDDGSISFLNTSTYDEYAGGSPVNGEFKFVYTQEIANITAGGITAILNDGFNVTALYALYEKTNLEYIIDNSSGYTILMVGAELTDVIPIGASLVLECESDEGTVSFLNPATYAEYAGGSAVNGKFSFKWTQEIADIVSGAGMMGILNSGFNPTSIYTINVKTELEFIIDSSSGYTILMASAEDAAKIPLGATVVLECPSDVGTVSLMNPSDYSSYAEGSPVSGIFSFVWTKEMIEITRAAGIMGILNDGFDVNAMYCHN